MAIACWWWTSAVQLLVLIGLSSFAAGEASQHPQHEALIKSRPTFDAVILPLLHDYKRERLNVLIIGDDGDKELWEAFLPFSKVRHFRDISSCKDQTFDVAVVQNIHGDDSADQKMDVDTAEGLLGGAHSHANHRHTAGGPCTVLPGGIIVLTSLGVDSTEWILKFPDIMNRGFFDGTHRRLENEGDLHRRKTMTVPTLTLIEWKATFR